MTSSISNILRNSLVVLAALVLWTGRADAGRKRLVVLDFEGPKADKFHSDVVKLIKKSHTVLTVDKWNEKAEEMDATAVTDKNIKKLAKKLKIDGVITGKIEKRRDEYIIRLKLRGGSTGETVGNPVQTKAEGPRIDAQAQRDIKDELMPAIDELDSVRGGDDEEEEEEEDTPKKKKKNGDDEEEEEEESGGFVKKGKMKAEEEEDPKAAKKRKAEEEKRKKAEEEEAKRLAKEEEARKKKEDEARKKEEAAALAASKKKKKGAEEEEEEEEEEEDTKKRAKTDEEDEEEEEDTKKRTASADDDEESIEDSADSEDSGSGRDLSPAGRALDAVVGMSFTARTLKFAYQGDLAKPPPGYKQSIPVTGGLIDVTFYPMSFSKSSKGIIRGIGLNLLYDRVLLINSQKRYSDDQGVQRVADLKTAENRWAVGAVLRYPLGKIVTGGSLSYGRQQFAVQQTLPNNDPTDIPNVHYTMITPAGFLRYPVTSKITANLDLAFHAITNTGQIQKSGMDGYGAATVTGFEFEAGGDYMVTKNIFARASIRYQTIGFKFKGDPTAQSNIRDMDMEQDVSGARDTYFGGTATVGYVY